MTRVPRFLYKFKTLIYEVKYEITKIKNMFTERRYAMTEVRQHDCWNEMRYSEFQDFGDNQSLECLGSRLNQNLG